MCLHHFVEIICLTINWVLQLAQQSVPTVRKYAVSREVADPRTAGIFIRDTTDFHLIH